MNRREFAEAVVIAALAPVLGAGAPPLRWAAVGAGTGIAGARLVGREPGALAKALADVIRAQYGERLSEADLEVVTRQIVNGLERAEQTRKVALSNGDGPDFVFSAVRSTDAG